LSSDILGTGEGREEGIRILPSMVGVQDEPSMNHIPFTIKSSTRMNRQQPLDLVRRPALGDKEQKRKAQFDKENCAERGSKRIRERSSARLSLKCVEAQKGSAQCDPANCVECKSRRLCRAPSGKV